MQVSRVVEVWEKGMDGAFVGHLPVAANVPPALLLRLFAAEQQRPDPQMLLPYFLTADKLPALQPYVATAFEPLRYDYILSAQGFPAGQASGADEPEPFD